MLRTIWCALSMTLAGLFVWAYPDLNGDDLGNGILVLIATGCAVCMVGMFAEEEMTKTEESKEEA